MLLQMLLQMLMAIAAAVAADAADAVQENQCLLTEPITNGASVCDCWGAPPLPHASTSALEYPIE